MADLSTSYMGLSLKNPLLVASCGLTTGLQGVKNCARAGAGAIVLKSMFEEQINAEVAGLTAGADQYQHTEALDYLSGYAEAFGPREYLDLVRSAKQEVEVPIIASVNCITAKRWAEYAQKLERAGADALEINVGFLANALEVPGAEVEARYEQILDAVKAQVSIPVALKLGPYFSAFGHFARRLTSGPRGADGLVLFNRFYRLDIDPDTLKVVGGNPYSTQDELHTSLRWILLLAGRIDADLAATTGIHDGRDVVKQLLAGATVTQLCSTIYRHGFAQVNTVLQQLQGWMEQHGFDNLDAFRGRLSQGSSEAPESYERLQYIKSLVGVE